MAKRRRMLVSVDSTPEAHFNLGMDRALPKGLEINDIQTVEVTGKVTAIRADKFGRSLVMTIQRIKTDTDETMGQQLKALRKSRRY